MPTFIQQVEVKILPGADVVVAGGGTAGVVAAIAAARMSFWLNVTVIWAE